MFFVSVAVRRTHSHIHTSTKYVSPLNLHQFAKSPEVRNLSKNLQFAQQRLHTKYI